MKTPVDRKRAEAALAEFLKALGHEGAELEGTPERVTAAYADELLSGYAVDIPELILDSTDTDSTILVADNGPPDKANPPLYLFYNNIKIPADLQS